MVYLIHFSKKLHHAQHYIGFIKKNLKQRIKKHKKNKGTLAEVSGRLFIRAYMGADSEPKASLNLHCNSIKVHGVTSKKVSTDGGGKDTKRRQLKTSPPLPNQMEDIPF